MARKKKPKEGESGPAWLITFTDMMTLMLTFFVLLVSMSVMDERRRLIVIGSLIGTFGVGEMGYDPRSTKNKRTTVEPGPMEDIEDYEMLKDKLWEDPNLDLNFESNKYMEIISINEDVLFRPGMTELTEKGRRLLDLFMPIFLSLDYPVLLAGHTSTLREEMQENYNVSFKREGLDPSWPMSLYRVLAVHKHLTGRGMPAERLMVEAFGKFRPKYSDKDAADRRKNRRVDIVMDKRNTQWARAMERWREDKEGLKDQFIYKGFEFDVKPREQGGEL